MDDGESESFLHNPFPPNPSPIGTGNVSSTVAVPLETKTNPPLSRSSSVLAPRDPRFLGASPRVGASDDGGTSRDSSAPRQVFYNFIHYGYPFLF